MCGFIILKMYINKCDHNTWKWYYNLEHSINIYGRKKMFYLTTHSTHFIYGYMAADIW